MEEGTVTSAVPGQRHVIERPRLTSMLDASNARIILLIAPAGYGKTTLARQWFAKGDKQVAWYRATRASSDVAALALGLGRAVDAIVPDAADRVLHVLRSSERPSADAADLARALANNMSHWQQNAWICLDDYHVILESAASQLFIETLTDESSARFLITTRRRPPSATARRIVYGEIAELTQQDLAFTQTEARELLVGAPTAAVDEFVQQSRGWPAVLRLASASGDKSFPRATIAGALHEYFADELFESATETQRNALCRAAILPTLSADLVELALGPEADQTCRELADLGFLMVDEQARYEFHPLLRSFLTPRTLRVATETSLPSDVVQTLSRQRRWDEAFDAVELTRRPDLLPKLVEDALDALLLDNRASTLEKWIDYGQDKGCSAPVLSLARAEIARRAGELEAGEAHALQAARHLPENSPLCSRAWAIRGECAHLMAHADDAVASHHRAEALAPSDATARRAVWGQFITAVMYEVDDAAAILDRVRALDDGSASNALRIAAGELHLSTLQGDLRRMVRKHEHHASSMTGVSDALVTTAFLSRLSWICTLTGRYSSGMRYAEQAVDEARRTRTTFAIVHLGAPLLGASIGLRRFGHAEVLLDDLEEHLEGKDDAYERLNMHVFRARLALARRMPSAALLELTPERIAAAPAPSLHLEALALQALAVASTGQGDAAVRPLAAALRASAEVQGATLTAFVRFIHARVTGAASAKRCLRDAFAKLAATENYDSFVTAYRAFPQLLADAASSGLISRPDLDDVIRNAMDTRLASGLGIDVQPADPKYSSLTKREREVYELLSNGLSNREIAQALYISEPTAKVHVRHILEKLGVRTRAQAVRAAHEAL